MVDAPKLFEVAVFSVLAFSVPAVPFVATAVVPAAALVAGAEVVVALPNKLGMAGLEVVVAVPNKSGVAVLDDAAGAEVVAAPKKEGFAEAEASADVVAGADVAVVAEKSKGLLAAELVVVEPAPAPLKRLGVDGAADVVVAALLAGAVVAAGFATNREVLAVVLAAVSAGFEVAAPNKLEKGVDKAPPEETFSNRLGLAVEAGAAVVPADPPLKRPGVPKLLAAG